MAEESEPSDLRGLVSVPGLVATGLVGLTVMLLARLFGPGLLLREVLTEVVANIGSTLLVVAVLGLLFRRGLERLLRGAPGGETLAQSVERLKVVAQELGDGGGSGLRSRESEEKIEAIRADVRSISEEELPALRSELSAIRDMLANTQSERGDRPGEP